MHPPRHRSSSLVLACALALACTGTAGSDLDGGLAADGSGAGGKGRDASTPGDAASGTDASDPDAGSRDAGVASADASSPDAGRFRCTPRGTGFLTDRGVHPVPAAPALPAAGGTYLDPTFGTTIMRVTDPGDGANCNNAYSYWPTFNLDSTHLHLDCTGGPQVYDLDPLSFKLSNRRKLFAAAPPGGGLPGWEDAIWSGRDPEKLYVHEGQRLWTYDVSAQRYALVKDLTAALGPGFLKQLSRSEDDDTFAFTREDASYQPLGYAVYRKSTDQLLLKTDLPTLDEVQLDKSGAYLLVKTGQQGPGAIEVRSCEIATGSCADLTDDGPDYAPGHSDVGHGTVIGADNWRNRITFRRLATPHAVTSLLDLANDWTVALHLSMLADDERWALVATYEAGVPPPGGLFHDELLQVATDGSQAVRRLAHTRSQYGGDYYASPRADSSRDGCFIAYTSNWGGSGRRDVFIVSLK